MHVHVKLLNGELITMEMETYSEEAVRKQLSTYSSNPVKIVDVVDVEKEEEEKEEKNVMAVFLPIHKRGKEFTTMLEQYVQYSCYYIYAFEEKWAEECRNCAFQQGYQSFVEKKSELFDYFRQLSRFLSYDDDADTAIRGDSYVNQTQTALQVFTNAMLKCNYSRLSNGINTYEQLCMRSNSDSLNNIVDELCNIPSYTISEDSFIIRGKLLRVIHSIQPISVFDTVDPVNVENIVDEKDILVEGLTHVHVLSLLKHYMYN